MTQVHVHDRMQQGYVYERIFPEGQGYDPAFCPALTPQQMLQHGVFEGVYMNDCRAEFPASQFAGARLSGTPDPSVNFFGIKSRQPLSVWREKGWIFACDPRGWFQWYCRYHSGRRLPGIDQHQIKRWRAFARHAGQIRANCYPHDITCRPRQRQALLQWAHDPFI